MEFQLNSKAEDFSKTETSPVSSYDLLFYFSQFLEYTYFSQFLGYTYHPNYKVNWDHKMSISVSNELNQTGMVGKQLAYIKRLEFLARVSMIGL